jgi:lipooligosaccharide transport system permease protein
MMVWYRNYMVWKKLAVPSLIGNLADPMIYLFGLGLGLGLLVGNVHGVSYIAFLAAGTTASSVMMSASFESMYSAFSRMHVQRTWEAIMHAPLTLGDVVLGEVLWAASKPCCPGWRSCWWPVFWAMRSFRARSGRYRSSCWRV